MFQIPNYDIPSDIYLPEIEDIVEEPLEEIEFSHDILSSLDSMKSSIETSLNMTSSKIQMLRDGMVKLQEDHSKSIEKRKKQYREQSKIDLVYKHIARLEERNEKLKSIVEEKKQYLHEKHLGPKRSLEEISRLCEETAKQEKIHLLETITAQQTAIDEIMSGKEERDKKFIFLRNQLQKIVSGNANSELTIAETVAEYHTSVTNVQAEIEDLISKVAEIKLSIREANDNAEKTKLQLNVLANLPEAVELSVKKAEVLQMKLIVDDLEAKIQKLEKQIAEPIVLDGDNESDDEETPNSLKPALTTSYSEPNLDKQSALLLKRRNSEPIFVENIVRSLKSPPLLDIANRMMNLLLISRSQESSGSVAALSAQLLGQRSDPIPIDFADVILSSNLFLPEPAGKTKKADPTVFIPALAPREFPLSEEPSLSDEHSLESFASAAEPNDNHIAFGLTAAKKHFTRLSRMLKPIDVVMQRTISMCTTKHSIRLLDDDLKREMGEYHLYKRSFGDLEKESRRQQGFRDLLRKKVLKQLDGFGGLPLDISTSEEEVEVLRRRVQDLKTEIINWENKFRLKREKLFQDTIVSGSYAYALDNMDKNAPASRNSRGERLLRPREVLEPLQPLAYPLSGIDNPYYTHSEHEGGNIANLSQGTLGQFSSELELENADLSPSSKADSKSDREDIGVSGVGYHHDRAGGTRYEDPIEEEPSRMDESSADPEPLDVPTIQPFNFHSGDYVSTTSPPNPFVGKPNKKGSVASSAMSMIKKMKYYFRLRKQQDVHPPKGIEIDGRAIDFHEREDGLLVTQTLDENSLHFHEKPAEKPKFFPYNANPFFAKKKKIIADTKELGASVKQFPQESEIVRFDAATNEALAQLEPRMISSKEQGRAGSATTPRPPTGSRRSTAEGGVRSSSSRKMRKHGYAESVNDDGIPHSEKNPSIAVKFTNSFLNIHQYLMPKGDITVPSTARRHLMNNMRYLQHHFYESAADSLMTFKVKVEKVVNKYFKTDNLSHSENTTFGTSGGASGESEVLTSSEFMPENIAIPTVKSKLDMDSFADLFLQNVPTDSKFSVFKEHSKQSSPKKQYDELFREKGTAQSLDKVPSSMLMSYKGLSDAFDRGRQSESELSDSNKLSAQQIIDSYLFGDSIGDSEVTGNHSNSSTLNRMLPGSFFLENLDKSQEIPVSPRKNLSDVVHLNSTFVPYARTKKVSTSAFPRGSGFIQHFPMKNTLSSDPNELEELSSDFLSFTDDLSTEATDMVAELPLNGLFGYNMNYPEYGGRRHLRNRQRKPLYYSKAFGVSENPDILNPDDLSEMMKSELVHIDKSYIPKKTLRNLKKQRPFRVQACTPLVYSDSKVSVGEDARPQSTTVEFPKVEVVLGGSLDEDDDFEATEKLEMPTINPEGVFEEFFKVQEKESAIN